MAMEADHKRLLERILTSLERGGGGAPAGGRPPGGPRPGSGEFGDVYGQLGHGRLGEQMPWGSPYDEVIKKLAEYNKLLKETTEIEEISTDEVKKRRKLLDKIKEFGEIDLEQGAEALANYRGQHREHQRVLIAMKEEYDLKEVTRDADDAAAAADQERLRDRIKQHAVSLDKMDDEIEKREEITKKLEEAKQLTESIRDDTADLVTVVTGGILKAGAKKGIFGAIFGGGDITANLKAVGKGLADVFNPINMGVSIIGSFAEAVFTMILAQDEAAATFMKTTGAGDEYNQMINRSVIEHSSLAVSMGEGYEAAGALFSGMSQWTQLSKEAKEELHGFVLVQERLGIAAEDTAEIFDFATRAFKMSSDEAMALQGRLQGFADRLQINTQRMMKDFTQFAGKLSEHGPKMEEVFKNLQKQAKNTGVEMGTLLNIASQFDTFEGAADAVGKLNALLGGNYLNSLELVNANEAERLDMIAQSIRLSGRDIATMGRFEKKAIAAALGFSDVGEAMKVLRGELGQLTGEELAAEEQKKEAEARAERMLTIQEKLVTIMLAVAEAFMPYIDKLIAAKEEIKLLVKDVAEWIKKNGEWVLGLAVGLPVLSSAMTAIGALGTAMQLLATRSWLALGPWGLLIGAITAFAMLVLKPMFSPPLYIGVTMLASGITAIGGAAMAVMPGLLALGAALAAAGWGISKVMEGVGTVIEAFGTVAESIGTAIATIAPSLGMIGEFMDGLSLTKIGLVGALAYAFGGLAVSLAAMAASLFLIKTADLEAVAEISGNLVTSSASLASEGATAGATALERMVETVIKVQDHASAILLTDTLTKAALVIHTLSGATQTPGAAAPAAHTGGAPGRRVEKIEVTVKLDREKLGFAMIDFIDKERSMTSAIY